MKARLTPGLARTTAGLLLGLLVVACHGDAVGDLPAVTIETLPSGAVHVRNAGDGAWSVTPHARWRVTEELRIGRSDGFGPEVFGRIRSVLVDELHRMWVVDDLANEVRVFDAEGVYLRSIGGQGSGPGEFNRIGPAFHGPDHEIWVEDLRLRRWERFDSAGNRVGGLPATSRLGGAMRLWTRDGRFIVVDSHPTAMDNPVFVVHRPAGPDSLVTEGTFAFPEITQPEFVVSEAGGGMPVPFTPLPWMQLSSEGEVWVSHQTSRYTIRRQTLGGDTQLVIERTYDPVPVPDSARERAFAELESTLNATDAFGIERIPRVYPPFDEFHLATDGTLWVLRTLAHGAKGFDVFEGHGRYLGQPDVPPDLSSMRIQSITSRHIYAVATDGLGVNYVVRLTVERPEMR